MLYQFNVSVIRSFLIGHGQFLQSAGDAGEDGAEVVEGEREENLGGEVLELVPTGVRVASVSTRVQELADLSQQQLHVHGLVVFDLLGLRAETLLQRVQHYQQGLVVVSLELGMSRAQLIDPLEDLGETGYDETELKF